jgi:hypothetical protein
MFTPARAVQQRISGAENWKSPYSRFSEAEDAPVLQPDQAGTASKWHSLLRNCSPVEMSQTTLRTL